MPKKERNWTAIEQSGNDATFNKINKSDNQDPQTKLIIQRQNKREQKIGIQTSNVQQSCIVAKFMKTTKQNQFKSSLSKM